MDEVMGFFDELLGLCSGDDAAVSEDSRQLQLLQQQLSELFSKRIELMKLDVDGTRYTHVISTISRRHVLSLLTYKGDNLVAVFRGAAGFWYGGGKRWSTLQQAAVWG